MATADDWESCNSAFRQRNVASKDDDTLREYLFAMANSGNAVNLTDLRSNYINHLLFQRHIEKLDRKNARLQKWFLIFAIVSVIASVVQIYLAIEERQRLAVVQQLVQKIPL
jgi:hypothetical protein